MAEEFTSIRISKDFMLKLDMKRMNLQLEGRIKQMTKEEFIEFLLNKYDEKHLEEFYTMNYTDEVKPLTNNEYFIRQIINGKLCAGILKEYEEHNEDNNE